MGTKMVKIISKNRFFRKIFLKKLSRIREAEFLQKYASNLKTLDIGAKSKENKKYFPNLITLNIKPGKEVDIIADAENLKGIIDDESFDIVLCLSVLEHSKNPQKIVEEIKRILKRGGLVIVSVPFIMPLHDTPEDYWRFTKYGLLELFKDFDLIDLQENMTSLETMGYLYHRLFLQTKTLGTRAFGIFLFLLAKLNYLIKRVITHQYGYINHSRQEKEILSSGILAVFRKNNR